MKKSGSWVKVIFGMSLAACMYVPFVFAEVQVEDYFSDPENTAKKLNLPPADWIVTDGEIKSVNAIGRSISFEFGSQDWSDYEIDFKLKRTQVSPEDQHFGIFLRTSPQGAVQLYCRGDSIIYMADSRHEVLGILPQPLTAGPNAALTAFHIVVKGSQVKVYVDNTLTGTIDNVSVASGKIKIYAYNVEIALKDLKVLVTGTGGENTTSNATSKNILHNSGFEQCTLDDLPDYWGVPHWGLCDPYWAVNFEEWQKNFITDKTVAYEGKRSLKIVNPENKPSFGLTLWSVCLSVKQNEKYALSAYMKSEPSGIKVKLDQETFTLTDKWQRYSTTFVNDNKRAPYSDMLNIIPLEKGTVWIDAVQLENELLTEYQPLKNEKQQLDVQEGNANKVLTEVPKYQPPYYDQTLTLTGKLDDKIWKNVPKMAFVASSGGKVEDPTEAQIWYNDKGIYIGVKCVDREAGKNKCGVTARDGNIWNDPSLELFIDPQLSRNYYYHLAVNQAGVQYDGFCADMSWNGDWKALTYTDPAGKYWSAEIFLPFGELGLDRTAGDLWGFNICRENHVLKEYSCWSPTYGGFHNATRFGQINIDRKVQENYYVGCSKAQLQSLSANSASLAVKLYNNTVQDQNYNLSARLLDQTNKQVAEFSKSVNLKKGVEEIFELGNANCQAGAKYRLSLDLRSNDNKTLCFSGVKELETPETLSVQTQYDLYTGEDKMLTRAQLNLGGELLAGAKLSLKIYDSAGKEVLAQTLDKLQQEIEAEFGIGKMENGDYVLKAELKTSGDTLAASKAFRKLPPVKNEVKTDHFSRMFAVNGKPFFPIGMALEGNQTEECIKYYAENGINSISIVVGDKLNDYPGMTKILDIAAQHNVKVILQFAAPRDENAKKLVAKLIQAFKDHPAVLAWFLYDEVFTVEWGKSNYPSVVTGCKEFKQLEPYHPSFINENSYGMSFLKNGKLDFPGDIVSVDHYAFPPSGNLQLVSTYTKAMWEAGRKDGKPCFMYLFGGGYTFWASRDLTPEEQEFETYTSIINGIRGIHYFADHPKSKSHWARMKRLFQEMKELAPVLASTI
ncbi:MAG: hypothetical protein NT118_05355, partial [Lentisphaerae bacterium]|nr:hypothetical protein [Lentisphaerota bacterium]